MAIIVQQKVNDFKQCYDFAENGKNEPFWIEVYKRYFYNMTNCMKGKAEYCNSQKDGVDRIIYLENHRTYNIDEKVRTEVYNDICLEYISNDKYNTPGWMEKDLSIDYLAYAFLPIKTAYIFNWPALKRAWNYFKERWKQNYFNVHALNENYTTISVAVPIEVVYKACRLATIIQLGDPKLNPHNDIIQRLLNEELSQGELF